MDENQTSLPQNEPSAAEPAQSAKRKRGRPRKTDVTPVTKAVAVGLKKAGIPKEDIQKVLHLGQEKLNSILDGKGGLNPKDLQAVMDEMAAEMTGIVVKMLARANTDQFIDGLGNRGFQLILALATLTDKVEKLRGRPDTVIETKSTVSEANKTLLDLKARRDELMARLQRGADGHIDGSTTN